MNSTQPFRVHFVSTCVSPLVGAFVGDCNTLSEEISLHGHFLEYVFVSSLMCIFMNNLWERSWLEAILACRWEGVRLPRSFWKGPDFQEFPNFPRSFPSTSPEVRSLWIIRAIQRFPQVSQTSPSNSLEPPKVTGPPVREKRESVWEA